MPERRGERQEGKKEIEKNKICLLQIVKMVRVENRKEDFKKKKADARPCRAQACAAVRWPGRAG